VKTDGAYKTSLIIQSNAQNNPLNVPVEGRVQLIASNAPSLAIFPNGLQLNFTGKPSSDKKVTRGIVRLSNQGESTLTVNDVDIDGPHATSFTAAHKCKGAQLPPDGHCDIEIAFSPTPESPGSERRARLVVSINGSPAAQTITLSGSINAQRGLVIANFR